MGRERVRAIRICGHCGQGFDAFRALDSRGRCCSPECMLAARAARSRRSAAPADPAEQVVMPTAIMLGSPDMIVQLASEGI